MSDIAARRAAAVQALIEEANKRAKKSGLPPVARFANEVTPVATITTGAPGLDIKLLGGWPQGAIVEIYGAYSSGKSTLAYQAMAAAQKSQPERYVGLFDLEGSGQDTARLQRMGIDTGKMFYYAPNGAEEVFTQIDAVLDTVDDGEGVFSVIVVDSVSGLVTAAEDESEYGETQVAQVARLMSNSLKRLVPKLARTGTTLIFINQIREKIGGYGNPEITSGGRALPFYAQVRVQTFAPAADKIMEGTKDDAEQIAQDTTVKIVKNKATSGVGSKVKVRIIGALGLSPAHDLFDLAKKLNIGEKFGQYGWAVTTPAGEIKGAGKDAFAAELRRNKPALDWLYSEAVTKGIAERKAQIEAGVGDPEADPAEVADLEAAAAQAEADAEAAAA